jgi:hypothetical protein
MIKIWIDDVRPAPEGYVWAQSVMDAQLIIKMKERNAEWFNNRAHELHWHCDLTHAKRMNEAYHGQIIELIDIDHDAGEYAEYGGDFIKLLDWLEETGRNYPIRIHSQNPVGVQNMRRIIERNGWKEVF